VHELDKIKLTK